MITGKAINDGYICILEDGKFWIGKEEAERDEWEHIELFWGVVKVNKGEDLLEKVIRFHNADELISLEEMRSDKLYEHPHRSGMTMLQAYSDTVAPIEASIVFMIDPKIAKEIEKAKSERAYLKKKGYEDWAGSDDDLHDWIRVNLAKFARENEIKK
jgi:hypothetical protein